jgi:predicted glycoside hydrolase/deacetylase ChbG (UPF0249 family)
MARTKFQEYVFSLDDIGAERTSDEVALPFIQKQTVDRVSIMTGRELDASLKRAIKESGVKIDIHLHLHGVEYQNALDSFWIRLLFMCKIYLSRKTRRTIYRAWDAQLTSLKESFGSSPDGINSHEHIHFIPPLFKMTVELAKKHGVAYIRHGNDVASTRDYRALLLRFFQQKNSSVLTTSRLLTSTSLYSFDWENKMKHLPQGSEIILHPHYKADIAFLKSIEEP